jgi:hypothetical protein
MTTQPMTLDQWGRVLVAESKTVPKEKRGSFEDLMRLARTSVGELPRSK